MTQFKDKSASSSETEDGFVSAGLLDYPVLQAADICVYRADYVPVGKDQEQHLELARNIVQRFNNQVGKEYLIMPEPLFTEFTKITSTADPTRKMSKSAGEKHYISIFSESDKIRKQVRSAVTDTGEHTGAEMSPGVKNLFELLKACGKLDAYAELKAEYAAGTLKYAPLKEVVAEALVELSEKFRRNRAELNTRKKEVKEEIKTSSETIRRRAQQTLRDVKELAGLLNVKY
jgi:tryptophanyl-tRNA synthetase